MFFYMKVLSTLLCLLLLHQNASAKEDCPAGKKLEYTTNYCVDCPDKQYKPEKGTRIYCDNCSQCGKGSKEVKKCTPTSDTQCKCMTGFTPIDWQKEEVCVCEKGSGIRGEICSKCIDGYFSDKDDSTCQKWTKCESGIERPGTSTSNAVCKNASKETTEAPKAYTTSQKTTTMSSRAPSRTTASAPTKDRLYSLWLFMLCAGIILLSGLLYNKCKVTYCIHSQKKMDSRKESVCRTPVEESGDKCLSLLV